MNEIILKPPIKTSKVTEILAETSKMTEISLYLKFRKYLQSNKNNKITNIIFENSERIEIHSISIFKTIELPLNL